MKLSRTTLPMLTLATLLAACGVPSDGYYAADGTFVSYNRDHRSSYNHSPDPAAVDAYHADTYRYDRRGYYDYNGRYVTAETSLNVPPEMFPPAGMCRVWFIDRELSNQPPVESCDGVRTRVPAGAYVIYGG